MCLSERIPRLVRGTVAQSFRDCHVRNRCATTMSSCAVMDGPPVPVAKPAPSAIPFWARRACQTSLAVRPCRDIVSALVSRQTPFAPPYSHSTESGRDGPRADDAPNASAALPTRMSYLRPASRLRAGCRDAWPLGGILEGTRTVASAFRRSLYRLAVDPLAPYALLLFLWCYSQRWSVLVTRAVDNRIESAEELRVGLTYRLLFQAVQRRTSGKPACPMDRNRIMRCVFLMKIE